MLWPITLTDFDAHSIKTILIVSQMTSFGHCASKLTSWGQRPAKGKPNLITWTKSEGFDY